MKSRAIKIGVTSLVLILALGGLLWATLSEGTEYYKHVDEVMADPAAWHGKNLQIHGFVVPDSILQRPNSLDYRFKVQSKCSPESKYACREGVVVTASYTGIVPDTFKEDSEVVLQGRLEADGFHVRPNGVIAKCPSKYEPKQVQPAAPSI
jgi:cytochrome c-type biogenesis protein CcmE